MAAPDVLDILTDWLVRLCPLPDAMRILLDECHVTVTTHERRWWIACPITGTQALRRSSLDGLSPVVTWGGEVRREWFYAPVRPCPADPLLIVPGLRDVWGLLCLGLAAACPLGPVPSPAAWDALLAPRPAYVLVVDTARSTLPFRLCLTTVARRSVPVCGVRLPLDHHLAHAGPFARLYAGQRPFSSTVYDSLWEMDWDQAAWLHALRCQGDTPYAAV